MPDRLAITMNVLAQTDNEAAVPVLLAGIDSSHREARDLALAALLCRRSDEAELELLQRWNELSTRWKTQIADRVGWISGAVSRAVRSADTALCRCACAAAVFTRDYDLIPLLVQAATDRANPHRDLAAQATLELAELLAEELAAGRDYRIRRDPQMQRHHVLPSLEKAATQLDAHGEMKLLDAFLVLANRENAALKRLLQSPADRNFQPLCEALATSSRPAIERLLLSYLDDPHAPLAAVQIIGRRFDVAFVRHLARKIGSDPSPVVRMNIKRIESIPWIIAHIGLLDALSEAEQPGAMHLVVGSSAPRHHAMEAVAYMLRHGQLAGRRIAAQLLSEFRMAEANEAALAALRDNDPLVRAAIAGQLRDRGVPGAVNILIDMLASPHEAERSAAQASLDEYRFERFLANFDSMTEEARRTTAALVRRVDGGCLEALRQELSAGQRHRRKRALELVVALDAAAELRDAVAPLLADDDPYLRIEAIHVLALCDDPAGRLALRDALLDPHPLVQRAAEEALQQATGGDTVFAGSGLRDTRPLGGPSGEATRAAAPPPDSSQHPIAPSSMLEASS